MSEYTTTSGTEPDPDLPHDPRTIERAEMDGRLYVMSEIGDGVFIQFGTCRQCSNHIEACRCPAGPVEPAHVTKWRNARFDKDLLGRLPGRVKKLKTKVDDYNKLFGEYVDDDPDRIKDASGELITEDDEDPDRTRDASGDLIPTHWKELPDGDPGF